MKIKKGYVLKNLSNKHIVVPVGEEAINFSGLITLNESGKLLFETLGNDVSLDDLVSKLLDAYEIDEETARKDATAFVDKLRGKQIIE
ncbi:PqqD family protein [Peloplasma aerotolerans]|uniref:PqqD family protein n=1 Tax=Peloplasma aerotolerans TaxID=3044389 RepID=A0AAW6UAT2_9MOLU|nr:PqqD family protein [Mariniplasma sp. M4Ah]MDI6453303.1 PqqD family protein [Mariniplasma sp. M4Ah]